MGAGSSTPSVVYIPNDPPPPRREEADYPVVDPIGIGKGMAQGCQQPNGSTCQLVVPQGVSSSAAKLYRDQGTIRRDQCQKYSKDIQKVVANQKAFEEVKKDLIAGTYYEDLNNGYCRQIVYDASDLKGVTSPDKLPYGKARFATIRKMSDSGGYSSVTKVFIKPAIPFEIEFNGKSHQITVLTLMHPSPIRVENVQHDAMLTLGDSSDGNNDGLVVLVPLQGALVAGDSGAFLNKITRYMTGVLHPDPATGDYSAIDIPTGNDWDLSKVFPGTPGEGGKTVVTTVGYYVWNGYPPLELRPEGNATPSTTKPWFGSWFLREPGVQQYAWKPKDVASIQYVMLSRPSLISSVDLQTIRMLPVTPVTEAVAPILKPTLSYRAADTCPPPTPSASTNLVASNREGMENKCDPFSPGAFPPPDKDNLVKLIIGLVTTFAVFLAIYFAVYLFTKTKWGQWAANQGTLAGNYISQMALPTPTRERPDTRFEVTAAEEKAEEDAKKAQDAAWSKTAGPSAEANLSAILGSEAPNPLALKKKAEAEAKKKAEAEAKKKAEAEAEAKKKAEAEAEAKKKAEAPPTTVNSTVTSDTLPAEGTPAARAIDQAGQEAAAGTGLFTTKALNAQGQWDQTMLDDMQKKADESANQVDDMKKKAEEREKELGEAKARLAKLREEREEAERKIDESETAPVDARRRPRTTFARTVPAPPAIIADALKAKEREEAAAKRVADAKAEAEAEAEIKRKAEEAAKSASAIVRKRRIESSDRTLPIASETKVEPSGQTTKVEDPRNVLGAYEDAVAAYESAPSEAAERKVKGLEASARGVSQSSPALKLRYAGLLQRFERAKSDVQKADTKSEGDLKSRLAKLQARLDDVTAARTRVITLQRGNPTPIALQGLEKRVQGAIERLDAVIANTESNLGTLVPEDQTLLKLKLNDYKKKSAAERKASNTNLAAISSMTHSGFEIKGGRRRRMKRKSTRRYVA